MKPKDKKNWIIKYCNNHGLEKILNDRYTHKKENWVKTYSLEIQAVCAIASVLIIGVVSIVLLYQSNLIAKSQLEINRLENKPIITFSIKRNEDKTDSIEIYSESVSPKSFTVDVATYYSFENDENETNATPIRVYTLTNILQEQLQKDSAGKIADVSVYSRKHNFIRGTYDDILDLARDSSNTFCFWETTYNYLIKVTCKDIYDETSVFYYLYNGYSGTVVNEEYATAIFSEWKRLMSNWGNGNINKNNFNLTRFEAFDSESLFCKAVAEMRNKGLYAIDSKTNNKIEYGEYEPEQNTSNN